MKTAYLVAHIDITQQPPVVVGVGIYSEKAGSLTIAWNRMRNADITSITAETYGEAAEQMRELVEREAFMGWVKPLMGGQQS